ncbi:MAG TPA: hypothetical protein VKV25_00790 [Acidimicrobiales bacterium]|nr:hypothetical protein [Acidimicrobiales bacterium]
MAPRLTDLALAAFRLAVAGRALDALGVLERIARRPDGADELWFVCWAWARMAGAELDALSAAVVSGALDPTALSEDGREDAVTLLVAARHGHVELARVLWDLMDWDRRAEASFALLAFAACVAHRQMESSRRNISEAG